MVDVAHILRSAGRFLEGWPPFPVFRMADASNVQPPAAHLTEMQKRADRPPEHNRRMSSMRAARVWHVGGTCAACGRQVSGIRSER